jgi:hypothetical protein
MKRSIIGILLSTHGGHNQIVVLSAALNKGVPACQMQACDSMSDASP